MKKTKFFGRMAILALVLGMAFTGCSTDGGVDNTDTGDDGGDNGIDGGGGEHDPALFGTWDEEWETITFNSDGSFSCVLMGSDITPPNTTWTTSNGVISLDFTGQTEPNTASYLISGNGNTLTTTNCTSGFLGNKDPSDGPAVYTKRQ
ncbi:MAG: hypothetical protein LBQ35_07210 [Spirochaetaceae bacterium]|nr:hypothetical protein [Spirochaetaceae bacterium]